MVRVTSKGEDRLGSEREGAAVEAEIPLPEELRQPTTICNKNSIKVANGR